MSDFEDGGFDDIVFGEEEQEHDHFDIMESEPELSKEKSYAVISGKEIDDRLNAKVRHIQDILDLDFNEAMIVLRYFKWNGAKVEESWFDDPDRLSRKIGISAENVPKGVDSKHGLRNLTKDADCFICCGQSTKMYALKCSHSFCEECWEDFLTAKLDEGKSSINATCPSYGCPLVVTHDVWLKFLKPASLKGYIKFLRASFVEDNKAVVWCPSPGCEFCVDNEHQSAKELQCECGYLFCYKCSRESHLPGNCNDVEKWLIKNSAESENVTWILANTKGCPGCKRHIEKNQGCNHMVCSSCHTDFCWLCLGPWSDHGSNTGGYFKCNKYEQMVANDGDLKQEEKTREEAKNELQKYTFYFERYNNHEKSKKIAQQQAPKIEEKIQSLHQIKKYPVGELEFLRVAAEEVIKCHRVLMWTYAVGYYLPEGPEKNLYEHLQEKLEENSDYLHELLEKPLDPFLDPNTEDKAPFYHYKGELTNYTEVTRKFFKNLLEGFESGLTNNAL
eukprot:CAMPEP_0114976138 /NCGR_PEP_ID=MMETSP0216-20121206/2500_1 /TAXON_ID=223996 /ORGANISM="Protocruzia adherens, Strain Boccale" /LENGTH=503 /DNA_ID=CAMNT_0002337021 /DNA_START=56 /DNA_END=1567 /DNA_ORIENTATION=-